MSRKTISESAFEQFCSSNALPLTRVQASAEASPDYCVRLGSVETYFEIKQLDQDTEFSSTTSSRTIGDHIRAKINDARNQVRAVAKSGAPAVLLIYNNLDAQQCFGTEKHDFMAAMYGEPTVSLSLQSGQIVDSFHGRNSSLRGDKNRSFSAIGRLLARPDGTIAVHLYENVHAQVPLPYGALPPCITFNRVELDERSGR